MYLLIHYMVNLKTLMCDAKIIFLQLFCEFLTFKSEKSFQQVDFYAMKKLWIIEVCEA